MGVVLYTLVSYTTLCGNKTIHRNKHTKWLVKTWPFDHNNQFLCDQVTKIVESLVVVENYSHTPYLTVIIITNINNI